MSTTEQSSHVSLSIPSELPPPSDNFQFMSDTFTLSQDGQSGSTQTSHSQFSGKTDFDNQIRHRGWLGGTLDKQGYGWLLDTTTDDDDPTAEENRPLL
jgi:hypothetical protein